MPESSTSRRRAHEAEFYGAMDGAARFNQRDALATVLITAVNIIAGFLIGVFQLGIPFREALQTYTVLTVGDGLVTMIPSLLVSMAGGIVVTRASSGSTLSTDLGKQLFSGRRPLFIASGIMLALAAIPGLPKFSFFLLAGLVGALAWRTPPAAAQAAQEENEKQKDKKPTQEVEDLLKLDELALEVGYGLVSVVDAQRGGQLLARVKALRSNLAVQLGFIVPPVHITDNAKLAPREYVIYLRGVEVARWELHEADLLAISSDATPPPVPGTPTREPAFGVAATWIIPALQNDALAKGYAVVDQTSVLATHLAEIIKKYAPELLTRNETKRLLDRLAESQPKLVEELTPKLLSLAEVQKVMQQLLREAVSIRDLSTILEALFDSAALTKSPVMLVEAARQALARALVRPLSLPSSGEITRRLPISSELISPKSFCRSVKVTPSSLANSGSVGVLPRSSRSLSCASSTRRACRRRSRGLQSISRKPSRIAPRMRNLA